MLKKYRVTEKGRISMHSVKKPDRQSLVKTLFKRFKTAENLIKTSLPFLWQKTASLLVLILQITWPNDLKIGRTIESGEQQPDTY